MGRREEKLENAKEAGAESMRIRVRRAIGPQGGLLDGRCPVYLVGGALRDLLCGHSPRDYDLLVRSDESSLSSWLPEGRWVGRSFRTLALPRSGNGPGGVIQVGTFSGDLVSELGRRDFSVNAMALLLAGKGELGEGLVDPFGGRSDLGRGILRRPDPARNPFASDPVRVLRLVRFVSERGFSVETKTLSLAEGSLPALALVAGERLREEALKLFSGAFLGSVARTIPADFLGRLFALLSTGEEGEEGPARDALLEEALISSSRISRSDPLFRLWTFLRTGGYQRRGRANLSVLTRFPWSRQERGRLVRWSRFEEFLENHRPLTESGSDRAAGRSVGAFTTAERTLVLAVRKDRMTEIVRQAGRSLTARERKNLRKWVEETVFELSRPWSEIGESLTRTKKKP
jgi:hypothetical protein